MQEFEKIKKRYALNNSYFKNRRPQDPSTPVEIIDYLKQHGELPYNAEVSENWFYECYIEYQKKAGVNFQQFFTPPETAEKMVHRLTMYTNTNDTVLDACSGFGMLTGALLDAGFTHIRAFDYNFDMMKAYEYLYASKYPAEVTSYTSNYKNPESDDIKVNFVISNPPYDVGDLTDFLEYLNDILNVDGIAVLLIPSGFLDKTRPARIAQVLNNFAILERTPMTESFERTKTSAEIVVLRKL